jgi:hypothetical protein
MNSMLKTFLPTVLICLASFTSTYYKPFFFEATATVNLTSLLVLTTMFISVMESLPRTAYIKLIDIWLIVNLCIPFCVLVLQTYLEAYRVQDDDGDNCSDYDWNDSEMEDKPPGIFGRLFNQILPFPDKPELRGDGKRTTIRVNLQLSGE